MSNGINSIHIIGRLGKDPELRQTANGKTVANMTVATKNYRNDTQWHRVVAWNKAAEFAGDYLKKGDLVYVEGSMEYREYDHQGQKRTSAEISASTLQGLSSKDRGSTGRTGPPSDYPEPNGDVKDPNDGFDDIPF